MELGEVLLVREILFVKQEEDDAEVETVKDWNVQEEDGEDLSPEQGMDCD